MDTDIDLNIDMNTDIDLDLDTNIDLDMYILYTVVGPL